MGNQRNRAAGVRRCSRPLKASKERGVPDVLYRRERDTHKADEEEGGTIAEAIIEMGVPSLQQEVKDKVDWINSEVTQQIGNGSVHTGLPPPPETYASFPTRGSQQEVKHKVGGTNSEVTQQTGNGSVHTGLPPPPETYAGFPTRGSQFDSAGREGWNAARVWGSSSSQVRTLTSSTTREMENDGVNTNEMRQDVNDEEDESKAEAREITFALAVIALSFTAIFGLMSSSLENSSKGSTKLLWKLCTILAEGTCLSSIGMMVLLYGSPRFHGRFVAIKFFRVVIVALLPLLAITSYMLLYSIQM